jgi:hypothetical protein
MIRINLLPESYRKPERTSPKVFAAALIGVVLVCSSLGWFGMVYFGDLDKVVVRHRQVEETLKGVNDRAVLYSNLQNEEKEFSKRSETVKNIAKGRMLWTKFMDELITVVTNDGNYERHVAWFNSIQVRGSRDGRKGPSIVLPGAVQGSDIRRIANLHDDVEATGFHQNIAEFSPPSGVKRVDVGLFPPESFTFSWKWQFVAPDKWVKNRIGAKPAKSK